MQKDESPNTPFDTDDTDLPNQPRIFNRAHLVMALQALKQANILDLLRGQIADVQAQLRLAASPFYRDATNDNGMTLPLDYLISELDQIAAARTLDRARYYLDRLIRGVTDERTSAVNDINLNRWKEYEDIYTDSLWMLERRDSSGAHNADYWGNFIPQIPYQMMRRYTKKGDWVLDTFAGAGTTLIEAQRLGRNSLGIELQPDIAVRANNLTRAEPNAYDVVSEVQVGDSTTYDYRALLNKHDRQSVQLVMLHPPYFDIITFSDDPRDLSNAPSVEAFLTMLSAIVERVAPILDPGRYLVLVIGDKYTKGEWIPLGFRAMDAVLQHGFLLKSIIVKNFEATTGKRQQKELWRYRALVGGFYIFKHEYIFVCQKR